MLLTGERKLEEIIKLPINEGWRYITTIVRLKGHLYERIGSLQEKFRLLDQNHYYYPLSDIHMTIIGADFFKHYFCHPRREAIHFCQNIFRAFSPFTVTLIGVNVSPFSVSIQVASQNQVIEKMRDSLLTVCPNKGEQDNYKREPYSAHFNIIRFKNHNVIPLINMAYSLRRIFIGEMIIDTIEFVETDSYLSSHNTKVLEKFELGG